MWLLKTNKKCVDINVYNGSLWETYRPIVSGSVSVVILQTDGNVYIFLLYIFVSVHFSNQMYATQSQLYIKFMRNKADRKVLFSEGDRQEGHSQAPDQ